MDIQGLQEVAEAAATRLPSVTLEHRVNPKWDVYKVHGKVFMLMTDMPGRPVVILKADPNDAVILRQQHPDITAGYHMNKTHWITAAGGPSLDETLVRELVAESYRLVAAKLPKSLTR